MHAVRSRLCTALSAALLLSAAPPAFAIRYWTYIGGCAGADWQGLVSGTNAQGQSTCWSGTLGGASGSTVPTASEDVVFAPNSSADLTVNFAAASRPAFTGSGNTVYISGTGGGFAGLELKAGLPAETTLDVARLALAASNGTGARGQLLQASGRVRVNDVLYMGLSAGDVGRYTLSGGTLESPGTTLVGQNGIGSYTQTGGTASFGSLTLAAGSGSVGSIALSGGTLTIIDYGTSTGGNATITVTGGGVLSAPYGINLSTFGGGGQVQLNVSGSGSRLQTSQMLVGARATVAVGAGGLVHNEWATLGPYDGDHGEVTVSGAGASWVTDGALVVSVQGDGLLTIGSGGTVQALTLGVGGKGSVVLNGGELATGSVGGSGVFDWRSGTLRLNDAGGASLGGLALPTVTTLSAGRNLRVAGTLAVGGGLLALSGGTLEAGGLTLAGGTVAVVGGPGFDVATVRSLSGTGTLLGAVRGAPTTAIEARGGVLTLGNAASDDGFDFDGTLTAQGQQVVLLDRNGARLGALTTLAAGGRLASANGLLLDTGRRLQFDGAASIEGAFTNRGAVAAAGAGTLTFYDDVSGPGSFAGDIVFRGLYTPGAAVSFGGGGVRVDPSGALVLAIGALTPGGSTRLSGIGTLSFAGALRLDFAAGLALPDAGATLDLLDFDTFTGSIDPARISVSGVQAQRLDFSQLAVDGTLRISAVPEPAAWLLMLTGLVAVRSARRPRTGCLHP